MSQADSWGRVWRSAGVTCRAELTQVGACRTCVVLSSGILMIQSGLCRTVGEGMGEGGGPLSESRDLLLAR